MNNASFEVLMQCPCSGDGSANPLLLLAVFAGVWLLFNWIKALLKSKGVSFMNKNAKVVIVVALLVAVTAVIAIKQKNSSSKESEKSVPVARTEPNAQTQTSDISPKTTAGKPAVGSLPRLVDLGAKKCIPCKLMAPILEGLKKEFSGVFEVDFIDVWQSPEKVKEYGLQVIPTQIFYDASGKELFRHEGFFSKEDILLKWKQLGIKLEKGQKDEKNN